MITEKLDDAVARLKEAKGTIAEFVSGVDIKKVGLVAAIGAPLVLITVGGGMAWYNHVKQDARRAAAFYLLKEKADVNRDGIAIDELAPFVESSGYSWKLPTNMPMRVDIAKETTLVYGPGNKATLHLGLSDVEKYINSRR